jgi:hypothetical protein
MVTPQEMRQFAAECMRWAHETSNPSHRDLMVRVAKSWMAAADAIKRRVSTGDDIRPLRSKLD